MLVDKNFSHIEKPSLAVKGCKIEAYVRAPTTFEQGGIFFYYTSMGPRVLRSRLNKKHPNLVAFQNKQGDYGPTL